MITIWVKTDLVLSPVLSTVFSKTAASLAAAWKLYRVSSPSNPPPSNEKVSSCRCQSMNLWFQEYSTIATGMPKIIACSTPTLVCQQCFIIVVQRAVHTYCRRQRVGCISHMADVTSRKQTERETGIEGKVVLVSSVCRKPAALCLDLLIFSLCCCAMRHCQYFWCLNQTKQQQKPRKEWKTVSETTWK